MCVIIRKPKGKTIPNDLLKQAWERNKDGAGFVSILENGAVEFKKGLMSEDVFLQESKRALNKNSETFIHFRIRSKGEVSEDQTHPFKIILKNKKNNVDAFLFHNGTISCVSALSNKQSDTLFLSKILNGLKVEEASLILENLNKNKNGKFVLVVPGVTTLVLGDEESKIQNGIWLSNTKHETYKFFNNNNKCYRDMRQDGSLTTGNKDSFFRQSIFRKLWKFFFCWAN